MRALILHWLRVPAEPQPPDGAPGSLQVFRAAPNFYRLLLVRWAFGQIAAFVGLVVAVVVAHHFILPDLVGRNRFLQPFEWVVLVIEIGGVLTFLAQIPVTFLIVRLEYEYRWYLVTDRSLRIRSGIWTVEELTMTFANIQELTLRQGPLQRLLGIADLKVRSAGGGAVQQEGKTVRETHVGYFHGIDNAGVVRDLILAQLRRYRDSGLGDPDEVAHPSEAHGPDLAPAPAVLEAARELLEEARVLRRTLTRP